jgi:hypothetical protein
VDTLPAGRDVAEGARLLWRLPAFVRKTIDAAEARSVLRRRFERRGPDFLALMRRAVYDAPGSPYRWLLDLAGCEYGDLHAVTVGPALPCAHSQSSPGSDTQSARYRH